MRLIDADALLNRMQKDPLFYLVEIYGVSGVINAEPTVDAIPIQYILTTIREWNRDGYAESAEALEILVMNWDKENTEWAERINDETD